MLNQTIKENLSESVQKISITDYLKENLKLLSAFWIFFSLADFLYKSMNFDNFLVQLGMLLPALMLLREIYATFPRDKKISVSLGLFYISMAGVSLFF
jgi:hypothetical protein